MDAERQRSSIRASIWRQSSSKNAYAADGDLSVQASTTTRHPSKRNNVCMDDADESKRARIGTVTRNAYAADGDLSLQASTTTRYPSKRNNACMDDADASNRVRIGTVTRSAYAADGDLSVQASTTTLLLHVTRRRVTTSVWMMLTNQTASGLGQ